MDEELRQQHLEIMRIDKELSSVLLNMGKRIGMSEINIWLIYTIATAPAPMTQAEICDAWTLSRQTVNSAVKRMVSEGLLQFQVIDGNQKNKYILFSPAGQTLANQLVPSMIAAQNAALKQMSLSERWELIRLLKKYTDASVEEYNKYFP